MCLRIIHENLIISLSPPITGAIVGLDQSSYEVNEGDGSFTVCVILYDGVPTLDTDVQLNVRRRRGGTAGIVSIIIWIGRFVVYMYLSSEPL